VDHIVLAGDSIFDNAAYVGSGQAVIDQLSNKANGLFKSTLVAADGSVTRDLNSQFKKLPPDTTHLFISSGGNDALESAYLLADRFSTVWDAMSLFSDVIGKFQSDYRDMLQNARSLVKNITVCTIYHSIPGYEKEPLTALKFFNEIILLEAFEMGLPVIDLRLVCNHDDDYSAISPIEPSLQGGDKISNVIVSMMAGHDFSAIRPIVWK
jgi:hypothetical protein